MSDLGLHSIKFDTFGWPLSVDNGNTRLWKSQESFFLSADYRATGPGFGSAELEEIRNELLLNMPESMELVDLSIHEVRGIPALFQTLRVVDDDGDEFFYVAMGLLFVDCLWMLKVEVNNNEIARSIRSVSEMIEGTGNATSTLAGADCVDDPLMLTTALALVWSPQSRSRLK